VILVTGGTGAAGPALIAELARAGHSVTVIARHAPRAPLPPQVRFEALDITSAGAEQLASEASVVFHLAARLHTNNPPPSARAEYERVNVAATARLAAAAKRCRRFVFFSTIDVYPPTRGGDLADESTRPEPRSLYGETKLAAEQAVLQEPNALVLRLAAVYGPHAKGNYARLIHGLRRGRFVAVGPGTNRRTLIHESDLAAAATRAAFAEHLPGRIYNVTDGSVHTINDIVRAIASALGVSPPGWHLPAAPVRLAAGVVEHAARIAGREPPVTRYMIDKLQEDFAVDGRRLHADLPFTPSYGLEAGWRATLLS
jgi:UDP-glucose 4-epimerase